MLREQRDKDIGITTNRYPQMYQLLAHFLHYLTYLKIFAKNY